MNDGSYSPKTDKDTLPNGTDLCGGAYRIVEPIGNGGFGKTYKAIDVSTSMFVAIKECFPKDHVHRSGGDVYPNSATSKMLANCIGWFETEAETLAIFDDVGIVKIIRRFHEFRTAYMVLEFIEGKTLFQRIAELRENGHSIKVEEFMWIARRVIDALATVHGNAVLHRDLTPMNIMLRSDGDVPVLIDFGSAREQFDQEASRTQGANYTAVLNRQYAPPEQHYNHDKLRREDAVIDEAMPFGNNKGQGPWTDVFALCGTFYFVLTGSHPPNATERLADINEGLPDPLRLKSLGSELGYPEHVLAAIEAGLSLTRRDRPQDVRVLYEFLSGRRSPEAPAPRQRARQEPPIPRAPIPGAEKPSDPAPEVDPSTARHTHSGTGTGTGGEPYDWGRPKLEPEKYVEVEDDPPPPEPPVPPIKPPSNSPWKGLVTFWRRFVEDENVPDAVPLRYRVRLDLGAGVEALGFDRNADWIAAATGAGTIALASLGRKGGEYRLTYREGRISCILPVIPWKGILVGDHSGHVALLDIETGKLSEHFKRFKAAEGVVTHLRITPDAQLIVVAAAKNLGTANHSGQIMAYSTAASRDWLGSLHSEDQPPFSALTFAARQPVLVAARDDGRLLMCDLRQVGRQRLIPLRGILAPGTISLTENGETAFAVDTGTGIGAQGKVVRFNTKTGEPEKSAPEPYAPITRTAVTSIGSRAATAWKEGQVTVWDTMSMTPLHELKDHKGQVSRLEFSPEKRLLATAGDDGRVFVYDVAPKVN